MNDKEYVQNEGWKKVRHTHLLQASRDLEPPGIFGDLHQSLIHEHNQQKHLHPLLEIWEDGGMKLYLFGGAQDLPVAMSNWNV